MTTNSSMAQISRRMISAKAEQFTESVIREMTRLALQHNAVNLSQGFPDFPAPAEIKEAARRAIADDINQYAITWGAKPLRDAVANVGRAATLAFALSRGDVALAGRCLEDRLAEPARSPFLRGFPEARAAAIAAGGSGCAISGSGSTVFALAAQPRIAERVAHAMCNAFQHHDIRATPLVTSVDNRVPLGEVVPHSGSRFSIPA